VDRHSGRRSLVLLAIAFVSLNVAAAVDLGPRSVDLTGLGPCDRSTSRCIAAAGPMLVWVEDFEDRTRLRAAIGTARIDLFESRVIDHLAVATDGRSFLVIWEHDDLGVDPAISAAEVSADGSVLGRATFPIDDPVADPPAGVVWNGVEYAIALPEFVVFWRNGAVARRITTPGSTGSLPAANGNSILVVRRASKWISTLPYPFDLISRRLVPILVANVIGGSAGPSRELLILESGNAAALAGGGDGYLLVLKDDRYVRALRLDQNGGRVNSGEVVARYDGRGGAVDAIATRDGWLVVWDDGGSVFAAELGANGDAGDVIEIAEGRSPAIVKLAEGRFRVVYRTATAIESVALSIADAAPPRRRAVR
jgi:hypothetical protein